MVRKTIIGLIETVEVEDRRIRARIDTGARMSSIDSNLAKRLKLGPIIRKTEVKSSHGRSIRPVVRVSVKIRNRRIKASFNIVNRKEMKFDILIGRNILKHGFLIDANLGK